MERISAYRKINPFDRWITMGSILIVALVFLTTTRASPTKIVVPTEMVKDEEELLKFFGNISKDCTSRNCDESLNKKDLLNGLKYMNLEENPCNDFYEYACGNWAESENYRSPIDLAYHEYLKTFENIFERWQEDDKNGIIQTRSLVEEKLFTYYKSCRKVISDRALLKEYLRYLQEKENMWQWGHSNDWVVTLGKLARFGNTAHFLKYEIRKENNTLFALCINPQDLLDNFSFDENILAALAEYTGKEMLELKMKLQEFETQLLEVIAGVATDYEVIKNAATDIVKYWDLYLNMLIGRPLESKEGICITNIDTVLGITAFLHRSDSETVQLYSMARFLEYVTRTVPFGKDGEISQCTYHMHRTLPVLMNHFYDMKNYSKIRQKSDVVIRSIFDTLRNEFKLILQENSMSLPTSELDIFRERIDNMRLNIGNLPENVSSSDYYKYANKLELREGNFVMNHLEALRVSTEYEFYLLGKEDIPGLNPLHVNHFATDQILPYYSAYRNKVFVPLVYLQRPLYSEQFWDILLYGDFAGILGHEILHGIYVENSDLNPVSDSLLQYPLYRDNIACLLNGTEHGFERIADVSGIHLAMKAFRKQIAESRANTRLFFVKMAQVFCESKGNAVIGDTHDISKLRINYVAANLPEFAESFGCSSGDKMNPETRCQLW